MQSIPHGYCQCGCGGRTSIARHTAVRDHAIKGQPVRYLKGHGARTSNAARRRYTEEDRGYKTPCWIWAAPLRDDGYAHLSIRCRMVLAHRYIYEQDRGPISTGLDLDHLCRQRDCVNPAHLEPVPHIVNCQRGEAGKYHRRRKREEAS